MEPARRVVITGAGGIGEQVARRLLRAGAGVHLVDIDETRCTELASALGCGYSAADLCSSTGTDRAMAEAAEALGGIDALVAVAGGSGRRFGDGPVHTMDEHAIEQTLSRNVTPALLALGAFIRHRDTGATGSAVLIGSVLARHPNPLFATHAYAAAKAAIEGAGIAAANYYAGQGVRVNVVAPGLTRTPMSARAQDDEATREFARSRQALADDGFVDPAAVAEACIGLLSNPAVTGQVLAVDAGWSVG